MKKNIYFVICYLFISSTDVYCQPTTSEFFKSYRGSNTIWERSEDILILKNGNILEVGETSHCTGVSTCYNASSLIWFSPSGSIIKNRKIGGTIGYYGVAAIEDNDANLLFHGRVGDNILAISTDSTGNVLWKREINHAARLTAIDLIKVDTFCFGSGVLGLDTTHIYSVSKSGNVRWMKSLTAVDKIQLKQIVPTDNHTFMGIALVKSSNTYYGAAAVIEFDLNGSVIQSKLINPSFTYYTRDPGFTICKTSDGNFVLSYAFTNGVYYVLKMSPSMNILWSVSVNANPKFGSGYRDLITADRNGGVWLGSHFQYSKGIAFFHLDTNGLLQESNTYSNHDLIEMTAMTYAPNCNLLIGGARRDGITYSHYLASLGQNGKNNCIDSIYSVSVSQANLSTQNYTVSTNNETVLVSIPNLLEETAVYQETNHCNNTADLCAVTTIDEVRPNEINIEIAPNPTADFIHIQSPSDVDISFISLFNLEGQLLGTFRNDNGRINIAHIAKGIYLLKVETQKGNYVKKIIKL